MVCSFGLPDMNNEGKANKFDIRQVESSFTETYKPLVPGRGAERTLANGMEISADRHRTVRGWRRGDVKREESKSDIQVLPIYGKSFVKQQINDTAATAAIAEAALCPNMSCVTVTSALYQARAVAFWRRQCLVRQRAHLINVVHGDLAEFQLMMSIGRMCKSSGWFEGEVRNFLGQMR